MNKNLWLSMAAMMSGSTHVVENQNEQKYSVEKPITQKPTHNWFKHNRKAIQSISVGIMLLVLSAAIIGYKNKPANNKQRSDNKSSESQIASVGLCKSEQEAKELSIAALSKHNTNMLLNADDTVLRAKDSFLSDHIPFAVQVELGDAFINLVSWNVTFQGRQISTQTYNIDGVATERNLYNNGWGIAETDDEYNSRLLALKHYCMNIFSSDPTALLFLQEASSEKYAISDTKTSFASYRSGNIEFIMYYNSSIYAIREINPTASHEKPSGVLSEITRLDNQQKMYVYNAHFKQSSRKNELNDLYTILQHIIRVIEIDSTNHKSSIDAVHIIGDFNISHIHMHQKHLNSSLAKLSFSVKIQNLGASVAWDAGNSKQIMKEENYNVDGHMILSRLKTELNQNS